MAATFYNDIEFKLEDVAAALVVASAEDLAGANALLGAPVLKSLVVDDLATTHIAVIVDKLSPEDGNPRSGNWQTDLRVKIVTCIDDTPVLASLREDHRQRCALVRDALMIEGLDTTLSAALDDLTVNGFEFGEAEQRIEGRSWVTEFKIHLPFVSGKDL